MRRVLAVIVGAAIFGGWAGSASATTPPSTEGVPQFGNVFVIVGENTELSALTKKNAPYLLNTIKPESAWLTNYWATTHYSESNYSAMTSGTFTPCEQKDGSIASCHQDIPNLFDQLQQQYGAGAWQSWMESMPTSCDTASAGLDQTQNHYAPKHNPALLYDNVAGSWTGTSLTPSDQCLAQDIPAGGIGANDMSYFNTALQANGVSKFNFIVPNECQDGHSNCPPSGNEVLQYDQFLRSEVPAIMSSPAWTSNSVLFITFDEGTINSPNHADKFGQGGNVAFAVISQLANTGSFGNMSDHYGFLRTLQDGLGTSGGGLDYLGNAGAPGVLPITTIWK